MEDAANKKAEDVETVAKGDNKTEETVVLSDEKAEQLENFRQPKCDQTCCHVGGQCAWWQC